MWPSAKVYDTLRTGFYVELRGACALVRNWEKIDSWFLDNKPPRTGDKWEQRDRENREKEIMETTSIKFIPFPYTSP